MLLTVSMLLFVVFQMGVKNTVMLYPFMLHSLSMAVFSSVIGPFGGFFASGFKRAFKKKVRSDKKKKNGPSYHNNAIGKMLSVISLYFTAL